jgi:hypothetical protein
MLAEINQPRARCGLATHERTPRIALERGA